jgi:hypothetical protein
MVGMLGIWARFDQILTRFGSDFGQILIRFGVNMEKGNFTLLFLA